VLLVAIVLFVLAFAQAAREDQKAKVVSDQFVQDLLNDDAQAAYRLKGSDFQRTTTENTLAAIIRNVKRNVSRAPADPNEWSVGTYTGQPETATIYYNAAGEIGEGTIKVTSEKVNGQWYVCNIVLPAFAL
jgi:hypothetical protein